MICNLLINININGKRIDSYSIGFGNFAYIVIRCINIIGWNILPSLRMEDDWLTQS